MPTQAVVFDVGGVLAHNMWEPMFDDLAAAHAIDPAELRALCGLLWETFADVPETPANTWRDMERRYWELFLRMCEVPLTVEALIASPTATWCRCRACGTSWSGCTSAARAWSSARTTTRSGGRGRRKRSSWIAFLPRRRSSCPRGARPGLRAGRDAVPRAGAPRRGITPARPALVRKS